MNDEDELFRRLTAMLAPQNEPPALVMELAKQSFALRTIDAELAALTADSQVAGTAAAVRHGAAVEMPRLLSFETPELLVELEISGAPRAHRVLGELVPPGPAVIEIRQPGTDGPVQVEADAEGRFVLADLRPGPFSLTCRRPGLSPVVTEWTSLD